MKKAVSIFMLCFVVLAEAQISNLTSLASGTMQMFSPIYEQNRDVYGYFSLYKLDKISENEEKYEYVILDKNLNKVANGEFIDSYYKGIFSRYYSPEKINGNLMITKRYANLSGTILFTSTRLLQLDNNNILAPFYFDNFALQEGFRDANSLKKTERKKAFFNVPIGTNNGYVVVEAQKKKGKENPTSIQFYNLNHEKLWDYSFGENGENAKYSLMSFEDYVMYFDYTKAAFRENSVEVLQIDSKTGQKNFEYRLEDDSSEFSYGYTIKKIDDRTILTGKISLYRPTGYNTNGAVGLFKIVLDKEGKEIFKKHFLWEDASKFIEMNDKGKMEAGYKLFVHSYFVFNDERIAVLSEKFKTAQNILWGAHFKTEDFVLLSFDKDFNLVEANTIEKGMTKFSNSDLLFAQYLNNENDAVFFYKDYQKDSETKEKNWVLGIVSYVNGKIKHERIPMSSDDFFIHPYIAKEGYVLLREFNKNSDFDKIRLERLNLNQ
ncbi:DUF6770 family protein [Flavisericum labens]|uniref:DUF6770 family protein n=1 Tax=Flavisericum labens TaxID=3377112 RepID=UPI00387B0978